MKLNKKTIPSIISLALVIIPHVLLVADYFELLPFNTEFLYYTAHGMVITMVHLVILSFIGMILSIVFGILNKELKIPRVVAYLSIIIFSILILYVIYKACNNMPIWRRMP